MVVELIDGCGPLAYIGPGAGFALAGSFLAVAGAAVSALSLVLFWPVRRLWRSLFRRRPPRSARFRRVVILGLDGLDHRLTTRFLSEGKLPNFSRLQQTGCFKPLASTLPPISPVAWSTFQTGVNPGKHNIFDFLTPDARTYQPRLSSVEIRPRAGKGWLRLKGRKPAIRMLRRSKPFWNVLSEHGIVNCIIRVPVSFPPEKLRGVQLSAMCVPDLRGTQGTFSLYTTRTETGGETSGGEVHHVTREGAMISGALVGPPDPVRTGAGHLRLPFTVRITEADAAVLTVNGRKLPLSTGRYTDWVTVRFRAGFGVSVTGVCRFLLLGTEPEFDLYVTPINIDPERPAMPIGYPPTYPIYLARRQGSFATLGLAEDTWGLNDHVLDDAHFLTQCTDIDREREAMFFDSLEKFPRGLCVCVFDGSDRMQHMFWRYLDDSHPARPADAPAEFRTPIEDLYRRMDDLVGRTMARCDDDDTLLMVLSDHGFNSFRRGIDLNRWLEDNGYLVVDDGARTGEWLTGVDWSRTRAFAVGLTGIFLNMKGRFERGIVDAEDASALREEIAAGLRRLVDPQSGQPPIRRVYQSVKAYQGPYRENAPDLIIGYAEGYRVSWGAASGKTSTDIFHDNTRAWSGDHCVDPSVVPGVLFANHDILASSPRLLDIAPTVLDMFGCPAPAYMDGTPLEVGPRRAAVDGRTQPEAHVA